LKVIKIKATITKKISKEVHKGEWRSWEVGFGAEAKLSDGENWQEEIGKLDNDLKNMVHEALKPKGGGSNQTSNVGGSFGNHNALTDSSGKSFGESATLAEQYKS